MQNSGFKAYMICCAIAQVCLLANFFMVRTKVVNRVQAEQMAKFAVNEEEEQLLNEENQADDRVQADKLSYNSYNSEEADAEAKAQQVEIQGADDLDTGDDYIAPY